MPDLIKELETAISGVVRKFFPLLVAKELQNLAGRTVDGRAIHVDPVTGKGVMMNLPKRSPKKRAASKMTCQAAIEKYGNKAAAARAMGLARTTFRKRLATEQKNALGAVAS